MRHRVEEEWNKDSEASKSDKYESISNISPKSVKAGLVTYGPFTDIPAFTESPSCRLHFPSKSQFRTLEK